MKLDNKALHGFLKEQGIHYLYHSNTIATSISYLRASGLLSRGGVEQLGLYQTPQSSDELDKVFDVWNDVFMDTIDLHGYYPRQNLYGPVSFRFSIDFLLEEEYDIWITKDNPAYWDKEMELSEKYFISVEELKANWANYQRQRKMVTIKNQMTPVLFRYLDKVILDDPRVVRDGVIIFNEAVNGLKEVLGDDTSLKNKFSIRQCSNCYCRWNYLYQVSIEDLKRLFLPQKI